MKKISLLLLNFIIIYSSCYSQETAQWRGDNRDGIYMETGLLKAWPPEGPKLLWHYDELGAGHASAAVTKDYVFTTGTDGENGFVIAFNHNGEKLWRKQYGKEWFVNWEGSRSTPLVENDKLYIMGSYGSLVCMNAKNGDILWNIETMTDYDGRNIEWGVTENLLIDENMLFCTVGGIDANVIALDKNTGKLIWKSKGKGEKSAYGSPIIIKRADKKILVTMTEKSILGIDVSNGKLLWSHEQINKYFVHANSPIYKDGHLYCFSGYGKGGVMIEIAADGNSVKELWRNKTLDSRMGGAVLYKGIIYGGGDFSRKWVALDWNTGEELFSSTMIKYGNTIMADDMLYCYGQDGKVALVEPKKDAFNMISVFKVPYGAKQHWAHSVIHNKKLYIRHGTSLMVYDIAAK